MPEENKKLSRLLVITTVIFIAIVIVFAIQPDNSRVFSDESLDFPQTLGNLTLIENYSGEQAYNEIKNMHLGDFDFIEGYVAGYWGDSGSSAKLWVSLFHTETESKKIVERMTDAISRGGTPFSIPLEVTVNNTENKIYWSVGLGQEHYYWANGRLVIWMALEELDVAETNEILIEAIDELILID
jgi:hypothetical protein